MRTLVIATAAALLPAGIVHAEVQKAPPNVNEMVKLCSVETGEAADAACQGFVLGVIETSGLYATTKLMAPAFCIPKEVTLAEVVAKYRDYLKKNREIKHFPAAALAVSAFKESFPCDGAKQ